MARIVHRENSLTSAAWMGDFGSRDHLIPGGARIDPAQWATVTYTVTANGAAAAAAVAITVDALPVAIPADTVLNFLGTGEFARVTVAAAKGATSLTVEALDAGIEDNDTAPFIVTDATPVTVVSGTAVGRTIAERDLGTPFGPAAAADDEVFLIVNDVYDASLNPDVELYRPNSIVKENFLPEVLAETMIAGVLTKLRAAYICTRGVA